MSTTPNQPSADDYLAFAQQIDQMREMTRALVAGFVADGFTDEQARVIVTGLFATIIKQSQEREE